MNNHCLTQTKAKLKEPQYRQFNNIPKQLPFTIQNIEKKKKKSILSQKMKDKKNLEKQKQNSLNISDKQILLQKDEKILFSKPKQNFTQENPFDNINYISLQEFQAAIQDQRTLEAYQKAIQNNKHCFVNKIVLHLTSGCNCFYSIFAAQAGAQKVYCVVNGHSFTQEQNVWMMKQIIKQNKLEDIIVVLCFKDFNAEVDIIIGQPMGYCMYYDGMLDRMIQARDLYLDKKNGLIFPSHLKFKCALIKDEHFYDKKVEFWNQVYSIPMKSMAKWISHQPIVKIVDPTLIVSEIKKFIDFNLLEVKYQEIEELTKDFELAVYQKTQANGLTIWFQINFNYEGQKSELKGSPWQNSTKFTHVTLYTSKKLELNKDENAKIHIYGKKYPHHGVSVMKVSINESQNVYTFS